MANLHASQGRPSTTSLLGKYERRQRNIYLFALAIRSSSSFFLIAKELEEPLAALMISSARHCSNTKVQSARQYTKQHDTLALSPASSHQPIRLLRCLHPAQSPAEPRPASLILLTQQLTSAMVLMLRKAAARAPWVIR